MAESADASLMMLNQWDGCCIGVPPTPYDAIEVKLKEAAKATRGSNHRHAHRHPRRPLSRQRLARELVRHAELGDTAGKADPGKHAR